MDDMVSYDDAPKVFASETQSVSLTQLRIDRIRMAEALCPSADEYEGLEYPDYT